MKYNSVYYSTVTREGRAFSFVAALPGVLIIQEDLPGGGFIKKNIKVIDTPEYTYKIQKTQISAAGGAAGLYKFLSDCYKNNFMVCVADKILTAAADTVKEYRF